MKPITTEEVQQMITALSKDSGLVRVEDLAAALDCPSPIILSHLRILEMFGHIILDAINNRVNPAQD